VLVAVLIIRLASCGSTTPCTNADQDPTGICANSLGRDNL
jgi:hypothetical protein